MPRNSLWKSRSEINDLEEAKNKNMIKTKLEFLSSRNRQTLTM